MTRLPVFDSYAVVDRLLLACIVVLVVGLYALLITYAPYRGFDITDDSFYLLWSEQPENVKVSVTSFGFYTRILYEIGGQKIAAFRQAGVIVAAIVFWFFARTVGVVIAASGAQANPAAQRREGLVTGLLFLACSGYYAWFWLLSPSYNLLNLLGCMVVGTVLLRWLAESSTTLSRDVWSGLLIGVAGFFCFACKPPTAAVLALITLGICLPLGRSGFRIVLAAGTSATVALLLHTFLWYGGPLDYFDLMREALRRSLSIGTKKPLGEMLSDYAVAYVSIYVTAGAVALAWAVGALRTFRAYVRAQVLRRIELAGLGFLLLMLLLWMLPNPASRNAHVFHFLTACLLAISWLGRAQNRAQIIVTSHRTVRIWLVLFGLSFSYAFGSSNGPIKMMGGAPGLNAALLVHTAATFFPAEQQQRMLRFAIIASMLIVLGMFNASMEHPYRLPGSIAAQNIVTTLIYRDDTLLLDAPTVGYVHGLQDLAQRHGWTPGTGLIDLTGGSPGASYLLHATAMGAPWYLGGYPGSDDFAGHVLAGLSPELLRRAWILTAPDGWRHLSLAVVRNVGLDFPAAYEQLGMVKSGHRDEVQYLWKPRPAGD